jgi:HSP20 family protein
MFGNLTNPGSLFEQFQRLQKELDDNFDLTSEPVSIRAVARGSYPPINVGLTPDTVEVYVLAAGLDRDKLEVSIQQNLLTISGERIAMTPEPDKNASVYLQERFNGNFKRVISMPDDIDQERIDASYRNGLLRVTVYKTESVQPRQIKVEIDPGN